MNLSKIKAESEARAKLNNQKLHHGALANREADKVAYLLREIKMMELGITDRDAAETLYPGPGVA